MAYVNVAEWNPEHVVEWLRGLEDEIQPYTQFFVNNKVNGCQLLTLARDDLTNLNLTKIGHQELVLDAVELLRQLHYNLTSETLQSLALKLGCKAQSLFNDLKRFCQDFADTRKKERVSVEILSAVSDIINLVKSLISWLDRYPFVGQESYADVRKTILKLSVELASTAQRDQFAENPHGIIKETCAKLAAQSDKVVQDFNDSLIIQPASLEVAKIKRKSDDDVGIHINSLYYGIHIIEDIKFQSPASRSGKVEEGDEIVQVNYQTVVGWQIKNIICAMKEHPSEVHLTLKKRPRHPNVLGQVITLWPYRIPSKKTALRKLYKWNKSKDIRDLCSRTPGTRQEPNSISETNGTSANDKEKLFAVNKPRNKLRRRATVTGISPTTLQAPVSLEELIGSNSKRKESVLRTISYDPNKTIDVEDNVFQRDTHSLGHEDTIQKEEPGNTSKESTFLRPPQEKFMTGHLKRQEALKNSETVAGVAVVNKPSSKCPPLKPPLRINPLPPSDVVQETPPSGSQSPKQKLAEWMNRQKKKPEGLLQHALTLFSPDSQSCSSPTAKENDSPKAKKSSGNIFQFPFREGRPSLSELRSLKRTANSKVFSERVNGSQEKPVTSPKPNISNRRNPVPCKTPALTPTVTPPPPKVPKPQLPSKPIVYNQKVRSKDPESCIHPQAINYAKIPQYPCEMHESKIVSLKARQQQNVPLTKPPPKPTRNHLHYQRARQMSALQKTQKSKYPTAFYSPSGRSLSFTNIAMSSDDSSSEEYEIYEELSHVSEPMTYQQHELSGQHGQPSLFQGMDPHFTQQLAEMYTMLSQRQHAMQGQGNSVPKGQINAASKAIIDELALRMYHALQMNHMQSQNATMNQRPPFRPPPTRSVINTQQRNTQVQNGGHNNVPYRNQQEMYFQQQPIHPIQKLQNYVQDSDPYAHGKHAVKSVREHPVDLPTSGAFSSRNINVFKSATSQEIHNLYTSKLFQKGSPNMPLDDEKDVTDDYSEKEHMYETIPFQKSHTNGNQSGDKSFLYPAEKEFELDLPVKDSDHLNALPETTPKVSTNPCLLKENLFCPIKEDASLVSKNIDNCSAFRQVTSNTSQISDRYIENCSPNLIIPETKNIIGQKVQPAFPTLMRSIPKPPPESLTSAPTKCSSSQTDSDFYDSVPLDEQSEEVTSTMSGHMQTSNDESYTTALNCTSNSITDSLGYCSSSSLSSNSSGSAISSAGSSYYYVETQIQSQNAILFPPPVATDCEEDAPLIDLRSPTMGISMLSKKRCEQGSSPCFPTIMESASRIVTDVEHTI